MNKTFFLYATSTSMYMFGTVIAVFITRLLGKAQLEYYFGLAHSCALIPLVYFFLHAYRFPKPILLKIQVITAVIWIVILLLTDYILKIDFRTNSNLVIPYVMIFFAAMGGMIGVGSHTGKLWTILLIGTFFLMTALAFIQRRLTGL